MNCFSIYYDSKYFTSVLLNLICMMVTDNSDILQYLIQIFHLISKAYHLLPRKKLQKKIEIQHQFCCSLLHQLLSTSFKITANDIQRQKVWTDAKGIHFDHQSHISLISITDCHITLKWKVTIIIMISLHVIEHFQLFVIWNDKKCSKLQLKCTTVLLGYYLYKMKYLALPSDLQFTQGGALHH